MKLTEENSRKFNELTNKIFDLEITKDYLPYANNIKFYIRGGSRQLFKPRKLDIRFHHELRQSFIENVNKEIEKLEKEKEAMLKS